MGVTNQSPASCGDFVFQPTNYQIRDSGCNSKATISEITTGAWHNFSITLTNSTHATYILDNSISYNGTTLNTNGQGVFIYAGTSSLVYLDDILIYSNYGNMSLINNFTITNKNYWDNSTINNFSAIVRNSTYSYTYSTTSGTLIIPLLSNSTSLWNVTINSNGYFNQTYLNYNVSTNLQATQYQSIINFSPREIIANTSYSNFTVKLNGTTVCNTTTIDCQLAYPSTGTYTAELSPNNGVDFHASNTTITITALQNNTVYLYAHEHHINITARDIRTNASINNFSVTISSYNRTDVRNYSTTTGSILIPAIHDAYNVTIDALGYALYNNSKDIIITTGDYNQTFYLYTTNSILFKIYNLSSLNLINQTVTISMFGENNNYYTFTTTNGTIYQDNLNSDTYRIVFSTAGFNDLIFYVTLDNRAFMTANAYFDDDLTIYGLNTLDYSNLVTIPNATITMYTVVNGSKVTYQQLITDFSGRANFYLETNKEYSFTVEADGYALFTGIVNPITSPYNIYLQKVTSPFNSVYDDIYYLTNSVQGNGKVNFSLTTTSQSGSLQWFSVYSNYSGTAYLTNITGSPAGGTAKINITIGTTKMFTVTYAFKSTLSDDVITWTTIYYIANQSILSGNNTYSGGLFSDIENEPDGSAIKGFFGMMIIIALVIITYQLSNSMTAGSLAGLFGLGINYYFTLMPRNYLIISMIVLGIILIVDNLEGSQ